MSSNKTVAMGSCPSCQSGNPYTNVVCEECGARLPWADAVLAARPQASVPTTPVLNPPAIPTVPFVPTPAIHTWATQSQSNSPLNLPAQIHAPAEQDPQPFTIRVSARILDWPFQCPCCGDLPDTTQVVTHIHRTGQRFVRITNENWSVPYCLKCTEHLQIYNAAHKIYTEANTLVQTAKKSPSSAASTGGCTLFARWYMACILMGAFTGHFLASLSNGLIAAAILTVGTRLLTSNQHSAQIAQAQANAQLQSEQLIAQCNVMEDEAREIMKDYCCWPGISVHYSGSVGTVHTFEFFNPVYAEAFVQLNASKIVQ
jgi:hypothetical protein